MPQFQVYANEDGIGYLLDLQTDRIPALDTRIVAPLLPQAAVERLIVQRLAPRFHIDGNDVIMVTPYLAAVPASLLQRPIADLSAEQDRIKAALDLLFLGI